MRRLAAVVLIVLCLAVLGIWHVSAQSTPGPSPISRNSAGYYAYAYGLNPLGKIVSPAPTGTSTVTYTLYSGSTTLPDGRVIFPYSINNPVNLVDSNGVDTETPSTVSGCSQSAPGGTCQLTFSTVANAHGAGTLIYSGTAGLDEAILDASYYLSAGGLGQAGATVIIDNAWAQNGGTSANIAAALPYWNIAIEDNRGQKQYWNPTQKATTALAVPTALTSTTYGPYIGLANGVAGSASWAGSSAYSCVAYVDVMGHESACSTTASVTDVASEAMGWLAPAASPGAVGWVPYVSVDGGTYALTYKVPLAGGAVCALTPLSPVPACKLTNTTYNQVGVGAVYIGYPLVSYMLSPQAGPTNSTAIWNPNVDGRTTYAYAPGSRPGIPGVTASMLPYTACGAAPGTTVPCIMASVPLPPGEMAYVGRTLRVCGEMNEASAGSTATISDVFFYWDAQGSNVTGGYPVKIGGPAITNTLVTSNADTWTFCQDLKTTVVGTTVTGGSIFATSGYVCATYGVVGALGGSCTNSTAVAAVGSLDVLAIEGSRIDIIYNHTTGTDGAAPLVSDLHIEDVN